MVCLCHQAFSSCSWFAGFRAYILILEVAGPCCHILGVVAFWVLNHHYGTGNEVQRRPSLSRWPVNLDLPPATPCCLECWFSLEVVVLRLKLNKQNPQNSITSFVFSPPPILSKRKKVFKVAVSIWSWPLLLRRLSGIYYL